MFAAEDVCKACKVDKTALGLVRNIFNSKDWTVDEVPRWAAYTVALFSFMTQLGFPPDKVSAILLYFSSELQALGIEYDEASKLKNPPDREVSLVQVFDNRYVQMTNVGGLQKTDVLDLTTVDAVKSFPTPLVIVSIVVPKLWWLSVRALEEPSSPHSSVEAEKEA